MEFIKAHQRLDAWKKAMDLVIDIYDITKCFPRDERFGIVSQLRRASVSIPSNIAEGATRSSNKEYIHFLYIALGSCSEIDTQMLLCKRIGYVLEKEALELIKKIDEVHRILHGLIRYRESFEVKKELKE